MDFSLLIIGLRKKLCLSSNKLAKQLSLSRQVICRYESKKRFPNEYSAKKIFSFIDKNSLDIDELLGLGKKFSYEYID